MATKKVETAEIKPKVRKASDPKAEFKGWKISPNWYVCPNCGAEVKATSLRILHRCPICGERAE